jgi:TolB-like protein/DNA-binding winged helix-turn-helix (wHTH) protein
MSSQFSTIYEFGRYRLDRRNGRLTRDGLLQPTKANTLQLLVMLVEKPDEIVSTESLVDRLFPKSTSGEEELARKIVELKGLLGDESKEHPLVRWLPGKGYRFEAQVTVFLSDAASDHLGGSVREEEEPDEGVRPQRRGKLGRMLGVAAAVIVLTMLGVWGWHFIKTGAGNKENSEVSASSQIAVLPIRSMSGSPDDERFDKALTVALIDALAKGAQVQVVPAASVLGYIKSTPMDQLTAGRELGVKIIVVGMAQGLAGRVRVKIQMVRTEDEVQIWTGDFDGDSKDVGGLAGRMSDKIGREVPALESEKTPP